MPLPRPRKNETKQQFISRCIAEMTLSKSGRFPDRAQRAAICYSQWGETPQKTTSSLSGQQQSLPVDNRSGCLCILFPDWRHSIVPFVFPTTSR